MLYAPFKSIATLYKTGPYTELDEHIETTWSTCVLFARIQYNGEYDASKTVWDNHTHRWWKIHGNIDLVNKLISSIIISVITVYPSWLLTHGH